MANAKRGKAKAAAEKPVVIQAIKGFNRNLTCLDFQYEIGKTYEAKGEVVPCSNGFHAIPDDVHPLQVFSYYAPAGSRYCIVEQGGTIVRHGDDKAASSLLTVKVEIGLGELIQRAVDRVIARAKPSGAASNSADGGAASNSGYGGAASNSGTRGAASNSGTRGAASNSGYGGAASNSGTRGAASNSADYGAAFSHAFAGKVMCEGDGQALYCTEFASDGSIASVACGVTGCDGIKAGTWYRAKGGKLVEAA